METQKEEPKNLLDKLKDGLDDKEEQMAILATFVRLGVVVWAGFIITLNYVELPVIKKGSSSDITFVASIFTGTLATFGISTSNSKGKGNNTPVNCPLAKKKEE